MGMGTRTPGPQHLFSRFRGNSAVYYLGTCVAAPEPEHEKSRVPIMNDIAGRNEPFQIVKDGENATIMATMNRFDWLLLQTIRGLDSTNTPPATPLSGNTFAGWENSQTRGTLVIGITDFQLLIWNEYATVAGASGTVNDQTPVRMYSSVELVKYKESTVGTRVLEVACAFRAVSVYSSANMGFFGGIGNAAAGLYTDTLSATGTTVAALQALVVAAGG
jgi:hypothetical protein